MTIVASGQFAFDGGEISPHFQGRVDQERYKRSLALCKNWYPTLPGPLLRRPGTQYVGAVKSAAIKTRMVPFIYSKTQAYMLELGDKYIRFWTNYAQIQVSSVAVEVVTPYAAIDVFALRFCQSADVLYLVHPSYPVMKLERFSNTTWQLVPVAFQDGPYVSINSVPYFWRLIAGGTEGSQSLNFQSPTSLAITGCANNGSGLIRVAVSDTSQLVTGNPYTITGVVGTTEANGFWKITVIDATHFDLQGSAFVHAYASGGLLFPNMAVSNCANNGSGLIRVTIADTTGLETGTTYTINSVVGTTEANGSWKITIIDTHTFDLQGSAFVHAYVSGGSIFPNVFVNTDIGRLIRLQGSTWGWAIITAVSNAQSVTILIQGTLADTTIMSWALGVWSATTGYPSAIGFHEDRLCFGGPPLYPQRIDCSMTGDYEHFAFSAADGTVGENNAIGKNIDSDDVNSIQWINTDAKGMLVGTDAAEWVVRSADGVGPLGPLNCAVKRETRWGSSGSLDFSGETVSALRSGRATLFVQRGARRIRELHYYFDVDGFRATDLSEIAAHITGTGLSAIAYSQVPIPIVWALRDDGVLLGITYDRDMFNLRVGWHQHVLGGASDAAGAPPIIESIAVIPDPTGTQDDVWMTVRRLINGNTVRTVEYLTRIFEDIDTSFNFATGQQPSPYFLDCGLTYNSPLGINSITLSNPLNVSTISPHGLSTGDKVVLFGVKGPTALNGQHFTIAKVDNSNFTLNGVNGGLYPAPPAGSWGNAYKLVTTISGLTFLENEKVSILADGAVVPPQVVSNTGTITLPSPAAIVSVGYPYNSDAQLLRAAEGSRNGTALGKTRRTHRVGVSVHNSQGLTMGPNFSVLDRVEFRINGQDESNRGPALQSGIFSTTVDFDYDYDNQICLRVSDPFPCDVLAVMPQYEVQDRA